MYQAYLQYNGGAFRPSPVQFASEDLAMKHAEKLADQFPDISDYRVEPVRVIA